MLTQTNLKFLKKAQPNSDQTTLHNLKLHRNDEVTKSTKVRCHAVINMAKTAPHQIVYIHLHEYSC